MNELWDMSYRLRALRFWRLALVLALLLGAAPAAPASAQESAGDDSAAAIAGLAVAENEATAEFPAGITFSLEAATEDPIVNVELMYRPSGVETYSVELPAFEAGAAAIEIEQAIDTGPGGSRELPPGIDVEYAWRITEVDGDVVETPEQVVAWTDDRFAWTALTGENVTVHTYDADPAFQQEILDSAERTVQNLGASYGADLDQQIQLWAYANRDDFYGTQQEFAHQWAAGANYSDLYLIMVILKPGDGREVARVVPHEISHQVLNQATDNPFGAAPGWLDEGLAMYWQEAGRDSFYSHALQLAAEDRVPSLRTMNSSSALWPYDRNDTTALYALSLTAVMYIIDTWGDEGMAKLLDVVAQGVTPEDAVQQGLGISLDELDRQWREDLIADAQQLGAAGSTRFGDEAGDSPWGSIGDGFALASGSIILGLAVLIALLAGIVAWVRSRHQPEPDDADAPAGVVWREWPEGVEAPRLQRSAGRS